MLVFAEPSYALFALVWGVLCLVAAAVVTETLLRDAARVTAVDPDPATEG